MTPPPRHDISLYMRRQHFNVVGIKRLAKRVFGFEYCKPDKFLRSPEIDAIEVSIQLTKLEADMNWTKRLIWLLIIGSGAGHYFD